ncbi:MAG: CHAT domain-containing protein [Sphingomonadaceae bacterium]|nr:CHAT domain-containing protein [Sphingomonadaceae bacterium]
MKFMRLLALFACALLVPSVSAQATCLRPGDDGFELADRSFQAAQMRLASPPGIAIERNFAAAGGDSDALRKLLQDRDSFKVPAQGLELSPEQAVERERALAGIEQQVEALAPGLLQELALQAMPAAMLMQQLGPDEAILMLLQTGTGGFGWLVTDKCVSWARLDLPTGADLFQAQAHLREAMLPSIAVRGKAGAKRRDGAATELPMLLEQWHGRLLGQFPDELQSVRKVYVQGSSQMLFIPFPALIDPKSKQYEVELRSYAILPSLKSLQQRRASASEAQGAARVLAIGAPAGSLLPDGKVYPPLPGAAAELRAIRADLGDRAHILSGAEATEVKLREALLSQKADVLLFSTHALLEGRGESLGAAGLVLNSAQQPDRADLLDLQDILSLPLDGELVILSACDTASAGPDSSDALNGLALAFLTSGARDVVVTNWPIADRSAAVWSAALLRQLADNRLSLIEAVRASQLELMRSNGGKWAAPQFWAPYVPVLGQP